MIRFEGIHCAISVQQPRAGVLLVKLEGNDIGELGDAPFQELEKELTPGTTVQLFIDARCARTASVDVSGSWAVWLSKHRSAFDQINMLTGSRFIAMSADLVRRVADLDTMRLYSDETAFDEALAAALAGSRSPRRFEGIHCVLTIARPAEGVLLITFDGRDVGEHGDAPFRELEKGFTDAIPVELFIDARNGRSASMQVSGSWAGWLAANRERFRHISMLTGSRFIELSAAFVRQFAELGDTMRLYSDAGAFEDALASSVEKNAQ